MKLRHHIFLLLGALVLWSCEERNPDLFGEITGVYFYNRSARMSVTDSLDYTFVYEASDRIEVPVRVQLIGRASEQDRPLNISVTSENAEEGTDYLLPSDPVLPAGAYEAEYVVTLLRTAPLKNGAKMLQLEIHANEYFDLPVAQVAQVSDTVSVLTLRITFSDMFTQAPSAWEENLLGEFTQQKFELICKVLDINPADFNDASLMTLAKQLYISAEMTGYVREQVSRKERGDAYDADAFDSGNGEPLTFS